MARWAPFRNFVYVCRPSQMEKAMDAVRELDVFHSVHTPVETYSVRTGKARKREVRQSYILAGYFFGRSRDVKPAIDDVDIAWKMTIMNGWGWCSDDDIERVTGIVMKARKIKPEQKRVNLCVGDKAVLDNWAFKNVGGLNVIGTAEQGGVFLSSPLFGGVPVFVEDPSFLSKKN